ncbi:Mannosylglycerate hydrolase [Poriferisphaera corsica]|uniref:Mannosylglycerate hydrolase n=1 Tax=Poriferisphaera corsica TaxID=2528020 RepID=A0A517YQ75_9BACT|nr:glycoside hydrolase family 38 C-terminal domain-containing protein [Poriferisphaera corsica]QDU32367.1 Mannosylglycerate hydrolase [Poriferisphaera corsica]
MTRRAHYVISTHWDREWYQPFQDYRFRLVEMLDQVLDGIESGRMVGPFQTDGQAIMLEDYLEVRPEKRAQIQQFAREGKLIIGPWYVLPDEFLVSGESLVRNIRKGRALARAFGGVPGSAGFVCDLFGHNSQIPQIFKNGFGIKAGMLWRGNNDIDVRLLNWVGADGTKWPCYRFGFDGYCGYAMHVRQAHRHDVAFDADQAREDIRKFIVDEVLHTNRIGEPAVDCAPAGCNMAVGANVAKAGREGSPLLVFDGGDHQGWDEQFYEILRDEWFGRVVRVPLGEGDRVGDEGQSGGNEAVELVHSSLDAYVADLVNAVGENGEFIDREVVGEQREPGLHAIGEDTQWHIPGTLSSRVWIKQWNAQCQALLTQWAEPLGVFGEAAIGREYPKGFLDVAWEWLLKNHPHDSICGCSVDRVHEDMKFRFSQCEQIGERLSMETMRAVTSFVAGEVDDGELRFGVFNGLPRALDETVELELDIPVDSEFYQCHAAILREPIFHVIDGEGLEVPVQKLGMKLNQSRLKIKSVKLASSENVHRLKVSMPVKIGGYGYAAYTVKKGTKEGHERMGMGLGSADHNWRAGMMTSDRSMSNGLIEVSANGGGSLRVKDLESGEVYDRLLTFEDGADRGDGWYHGPSVNDEIYSSVGSGGNQVSVVADGPHVGTLRMRTVMRVPKCYIKGDMECRSEEMVEQVMDSYVTIRPGKKRIEVETVVKNEAKDHRVRVLLPSGAKGAETYLADSQYDVIERKIALRADNHLYREPELETKPMVGWAGVANGKRGLVVLSEGLMECAVQDNEERVVALTLFRGTEQTVMTDGEPRGQLLGKLRFKYWVEFVGEGEINREAMCYLSQQLLAGGEKGIGCVRSAHLGLEDVAFYRGRDAGRRADLPWRSDWLEAEGAVVSAVEKRQVQGRDGLEIRMFNPQDEKSCARLKLNRDWIDFNDAVLVDMEGNEVEGAIKVEDKDQVVVMLGAKGIVTVRLILPL